MPNPRSTVTAIYGDSLNKAAESVVLLGPLLKLSSVMDDHLINLKFSGVLL